LGEERRKKRSEAAKNRTCRTSPGPVTGELKKEGEGLRFWSVSRQGVSGKKKLGYTILKRKKEEGANSGNSQTFPGDGLHAKRVRQLGRWPGIRTVTDSCRREFSREKNLKLGANQRHRHRRLNKVCRGEKTGMA